MESRATWHNSKPKIQKFFNKQKSYIFHAVTWRNFKRKIQKKINIRFFHTLAEKTNFLNKDIFLCHLKQTNFFFLFLFFCVLIFQHYYYFVFCFSCFDARNQTVLGETGCLSHPYFFTGCSSIHFFIHSSFPNRANLDTVSTLLLTVQHVCDLWDHVLWHRSPGTSNSTLT